MIPCPTCDGKRTVLASAGAGRPKIYTPCPTCTGTGVVRDPVPEPPPVAEASEPEVVEDHGTERPEEPRPDPPRRRRAF